MVYEVKYSSVADKELAEIESPLTPDIEAHFGASVCPETMTQV